MSSSCLMIFTLLTQKGGILFFIKCLTSYHNHVDMYRLEKFFCTFFLFIYYSFLHDCSCYFTLTRGNVGYIIYDVYVYECHSTFTFCVRLHSMIGLHLYLIQMHIIVIYIYNFQTMLLCNFIPSSF